METIVERIKNAFQKTTDRLSGRHIPVQQSSGRVEVLSDRILSRPAVDIYENDQEVLIRADVPGADTHNTWVTWDEHQGLTLYTRNDVVMGKESPIVIGDGNPTDWYQEFRLPDYVVGKEVRATLENGVLSVHLSKRKAPEPIRIPVRAQ